MAIIKDGHLGVELKFKEWSCGDYIVYDIRFFYGSFPLFNPKILLKDSINFAEYGEDTLIPVLENVLNTNSNRSWYPLENEFEILIQPMPEIGYEDIENNKNVWVSEKEKIRLMEIEVRRKFNKGLLPEDSFNLYFFFNSLNFKQISKAKDKRSEWNIGAGLKISVNRKELEKFIKDLMIEYKEFKRNKH